MPHADGAVSCALEAVVGQAGTETRLSGPEFTGCEAG
jgi:hypothetical protein